MPELIGYLQGNAKVDGQPIRAVRRLAVVILPEPARVLPRLGGAR